jgi:hypothetical protein
MPDNYDWKKEAIPVSSGGDYDWRKDAVPVSVAPKKEAPLLSKEGLSNAWDATGTFLGNAVEAFPLTGPSQYIGDRTYAAQQVIGQNVADLFRDKPEAKSFDDYVNESKGYRNIEQKKLAEKSQEHPYAAGAGQVTGALSGAVIPVPGANVAGVPGALARIGGQSALSAVSEGFAGGEYSPEAAQRGATGLAPMIQTGLEAIPYLGKGAGYVGKKIISWLSPVVGGPKAEIVAEYIENHARMGNALSPDDLNDVIKADVNDLKFRVEQQRQALSQVKEAGQSKLSEMDDTIRLAREKAGLEANQSADEVYNLRNAAADAKGDYALAKQAKLQELGSVAPPEELAGQLPKTVEQIRAGKLTEASNKAWQVLEDEAIPVLSKPLSDFVRNKANERFMTNGVVPEFAKGSYQRLMTLADNIDQMGTEIPATEVKKFIQLIDPNVNWDRAAGEFLPYYSSILGQVRHEASSAIKTNSPAYTKIMAEEVQPMTVLTKGLSQVFGDEASASRALRSIGDGTSPEAKATLKLLSDMDRNAGTNFVGQVQDYIKSQKILSNPIEKSRALEALPEWQKAAESSEKVALAERGRELARRKASSEIYGLQEQKRLATDAFGQEVGQAEQGLQSAQGAYQPTSVLENSNINTILRQSTPTQQRGIQALEQSTGKPYGQMTRDTYVTDQFSKASPDGSRKVNLGAIIGRTVGGAAIGGVAGEDWKSTAAGAITGAAANQYGGKAIKFMIDAAQGTKAAAPLYNAIQRGSTATSATHYLLMQSDPEYRKKYLNQSGE